ncbi:MAG: type VII secretion integral membrane protein EccD [Mycobacterium sp.]
MSVRRVCVHTDRDGDPVTVDVALPSGAPVGELVPAIVDMVDGRLSQDAAAAHWRLDRVTGGPLDEALSLVDNGIHDGELLTLSRRHTPALGPARTEPAHAAATAPQSGVDLAKWLPETFCASACTLTSVALAASAGSSHATPNLIVAAVGTLAAAVMSATTGYGIGSSLAVVALASATGFLAVPSVPAAPNAFLAAAAALCASLLTLRLSGRMSQAMTATAAFSLPSAFATAVAMPAAGAGAALSSAGLALLAMAPRLSVLAARLAIDDGDLADRVDSAHATLSGLVVGGAAAVATGAIVVTTGGAAGSPAVLAFTGILAVVLLLRARVYADPIRRIALAAAGFASAAACLLHGLAIHPEYAGAVGGVLVAIALVAVRRPTMGAFWSRMLDRFEYVALAAVVPVAGWVAGVYDLVGGLRP